MHNTDILLKCVFSMVLVIKNKIIFYKNHCKKLDNYILCNRLNYLCP